MGILSVMFFLFVLVQADMAFGAQHRTPGDDSGRRLVTGVIHDPPYLIKNDDGTWSGLNADLWASIARKLKLDYGLKEMKLEDLVAGLNEGTIDLSIVGMFITPEREELFDYSVPIGSTRLAVMTLPHAIDHPWWGVFQVFSSRAIVKVILFLVLLIVVAGAFFWLVERKYNPEHFGGGTLKGIGAGIYWVGATLASGVCLGINIKTLAGRILALMWMFLCAVIFSAFIASLASSLTLEHLTGGVADKETLRHMRIGVVKGGISQRILAQMGLRPVLLEGVDDAANALLGKKIDGVFYDEMTLRYYADRLYKERLSVYPTDLKRIQIAFAMPAESKLRKPINKALLTIMNEPLWESLLDRYGFKENLEAKETPRRWRKK